MTHTDIINETAYHELCNGSILYNRGHTARAAVYGEKIILTKGNVQHTFHVETPVKVLHKCWTNLIYKN